MLQNQGLDVAAALTHQETSLGLGLPWGQGKVKVVVRVSVGMAQK